MVDSGLLRGFSTNLEMPQLSQIVDFGYVVKWIGILEERSNLGTFPRPGKDTMFHANASMPNAVIVV